MKIRTKRDLEFVIKADRMMNRGKFKWELTDRIKHIVAPDYIMQFLESMRKLSFYSGQSNSLSSKIFMVYWARKYKRLGIKLGFSIGKDTLGYGVVIPHYGTIVVGGSNQIGSFAVLHTSTCITANGKVIGDGLYLSTGAKMTSKIVLGNNVSVGANSVVNKSFEEDNIMIGGAPARKIKDTLAWYERDGESFRKKVLEVNELKSRMLG